MTTPSSTEDRPRLIAAPGMAINDVIAASSAPLRPPHEHDGRGFVQPDDAHVFVLRVGDRTIELPAGRFSVLETLHGTVVRLRSTPQLDAEPLGAAADLTRDLRERLEKAGFAAGEGMTDSAFRDRLAEDGGARAGKWRAGEWMAEIWGKRHLEANGEAGRLAGVLEDTFLLTLVVWDIRGAAALVG